MKPADALCLVCLALTGACRLVPQVDPETYAKFRAISVGMTEEQVRQNLGEPTFVHQRGAQPEIYCVQGWACERREIQHKLLIYRGVEPIAYVFFDSSGKVEHVFVGGS
jgi:SmpA / OmlA family